MDYKRCASCPLVHGPCPAFSHPRYCDLVAGATGSAEYWRTEVLAKSLTYVPPERPQVPDDGDGNRHRLVVRCHVNGFTGYGQLAAELGKAVERTGVPVVYQPFGPVGGLYLDADPFCLDRLAPNPRDEWVLQLAPPDIAPPHGKRVALFSMWETTRLPDAVLPIVGGAEGVAVPSEFNQVAFGPRAKVIPLGVRQDEVHQPPRARPFVVGTSGRLAHGGQRKGFAELATAFLDAFPSEPDVRLRVKCWADCDVPEVLTSDPRIELDRSAYSDAEMRAWYRGLSVYATASYGEGFGLQPLQAMACGRAVIATGATGHAEYHREGSGWVVPHVWEPARGYYEGRGEWARADHGGLVAALRAAYEDPPGLRVKSHNASLAARSFTWDRMAEGLVGWLRDLGALRCPEHSRGESTKVRRDKPQAARGPTTVGRRTGGCGCGKDRPRAGGTLWYRP